MHIAPSQYVSRLLRALRVEDVVCGGWCTSLSLGGGDNSVLVQVVALVCVYLAGSRNSAGGVVGAVDESVRALAIELP